MRLRAMVVVVRLLPGFHGVRALAVEVSRLSSLCRGGVEVCVEVCRGVSRLTPCGGGVEVSRLVSRLSRCRGVEAVEALHSVEAYVHP